MTAIDEIDPTSIPGCCVLSAYGSVNRDVLKITLDSHGNRVYDPTRLEMVKQLALRRFTDLLDNELQADPLKVFVKQEPHKETKLLDGRYRLITGVSLIDTIVDRIIFGELIRTAAKPTNTLRTPCAVGWAPNKGGWRWISMHYRNGFSIDRTAWDWTVNEWMVQMWETFILNLCPGHPLWWRQMVKNRFILLFYIARYSFPDGQLIAQANPGIMKSGCLLTLILNSVGQTILHVLVQFRLNKNPLENMPLCMGDDTLQPIFPYRNEYAAELSKFALLKEAETTYGYAEFVGFIFTSNGYFPSYWKKHLFQLRHLDQTVMRETLLSYQMLWYYVPTMLNFIRSIAWKIDSSWILSDQQLCANANG